jgi:hypothetical protein
MTKFSFKPTLSQQIKAHLLPDKPQIHENLITELLNHQKTHLQADLQRVANSIGCIYKPIRENSIHLITTEKDRAEGCTAESFCSLAILIIHAMAAKEGFQRITDLVDGGECAQSQLSKLVPGAAEDISSHLMRQICLDPTSELLISPTVTAREFEWIEQSQKKLYGDDAVNKEIYEDWYEANPTGFFVFYYKKKIIGHLTLLPFREDAFLPYEQGLIRETILTGNDIWKPTDRQKINLLYVESYMLSGVFSDIITLKIREKFLEMANDVAILDNLNKGIYAMDATPDGINSIRKMGFEIVLPLNGKRVDGHTMNVASVDVIRGKLSKLNTRIMEETTRKFIRDMEKTKKYIPTKITLNSHSKEEIVSRFDDIIDHSREPDCDKAKLILQLEELNKFIKIKSGMEPNLLALKSAITFLNTL